MLDWHTHFTYDPTIPEAIRWKGSVESVLRKEMLYRIPPGKIAGRSLGGPGNHRNVRLLGHSYSVRKIVVEMMTGLTVPKGRSIIAIGDKADHRIENLRLSLFYPSRHTVEDQGRWPVDGDLTRLLAERRAA